MSYSFPSEMLVLILIFKLCVGLTANSLTIRVEEPKNSGIYVEKDLIKFIEQSKENMTGPLETSQVKKKALMVMGLTGTGKSTLVNYLNDIPLIGKKVDRKLVVAPKYAGLTLPGGFSIGHRAQSETIYPAVYSKAGDDFSYIDNPGFRDTRGLTIEIANGYFREVVTKNAVKLKFLLLLSHEDLNQRGQQFRESIKGFADFLGIFDDGDPLIISESIGIVITRVENDGDTDEEMIEAFKERLNEIIDDEKEDENFDNTIPRNVFKEIIKRNQIQIFSTPDQNVDVDNKQKIKILKLIDDLEYMEKKEARIRVRIEQTYLSKLLAYIEGSFKEFESFLDDLFKNSLSEFFIKSKENLKTCGDASVVYNLVEKIQHAGIKFLSLDEFLQSIDMEILSQNEKDILISKKELLDFLISFLPEKNRGSVTFVRQWLSVDSKKKIELFQDEIIEYGKNELGDFIRDFQKKIQLSVLVYFNREKFKATNAQDAANIYSRLNDIYEIGIQKNDFNYFLNKLGSDFFDANDTQIILNKKSIIEKFSNLLADEKQKSFSFNRIWLNVDVSSIFLKYFHELVTFVNGQFDDFEHYLSSKLSQNIKVYFRKEIDEANSIQNIINIENYLLNLKSNLSQTTTFEKFLNQISSLILDEKDRDEIKAKKSILDSFTNRLDKQNKNIFPIEKKWIDISLNYKIDTLINELKQYYFTREPSFENGVFTYYGFFSSMTEVLPKLQNSANIFGLQRIQIFTTHSFSFDTDFLLSEDNYLTNHPDLVIITPKLYFQKKVTVDLTCKTVPEYPDKINKANNGKGVGDSGDDGKPGLPGFNGGNLIIYADTIINQKNLVFSSIGGSGGPGQTGGDGTDGKKGENTLFSEVTEDCAYNDLACKRIIFTEIPTITFFSEEKQKCKPELLNQCYLVKVDILVENIGKKTSVRYYARDGGKGSVGGNSGRGGQGGLPGYGGSSILMTKDSYQAYNDQSGKNGLNGKPGTAGNGGRNGDTAMRGFFIRTLQGLSNALTFNLASTSDRHYFDQEYDKMIESKTRQPDGTVLIELNTQDIQSANQSIIEFYERETDYLKFIIETSPDFKYSHLIDREFCKQLIKEKFFDPNVESFINRFQLLNRYQTKHLLNELKNELIEYFKDKEISFNDKLAYNYTFNALSSSIYRYNSLDQTALVLDVKSFLELTVEQINNWKSLAQQDVREVYRKNYENNLKTKIDEATSLVTVLTSDIQENEKNMNKIIKDIVEEVKIMQKKTHKEDSKLVEKKRRLEKSILLKKIFSFVNVGCQVLSFLGPEAKLVGSVIQTGVGVANMFIKSEKLPEIKVNPSLEKAITGVADKIRKSKETEYKNIKTELERLELEAKIDAGKVNRSLTLFERIDKLPDSVFKFELSKKHGQFVQKDTSDVKTQKETQKIIDEADEKLKIEKKKVDYAEKISQALPMLVDTIKVAKDVYDTFKKGDEQLEIMSEAIQKNAQNFHNLNKMEETINGFENVFVKNLQNQLNDITSNMKGSSIVSLDMTRWNTKRMLDEFKDNVMLTLGSFNDSSNMITTINRLENSLLTMTNIYEKIESYMEQNDFASFIADITQTELSIAIPLEYQSKINELKKSIHANIIIERYQQAIEAFKYWSFPFFCQYTSDITIYETKENFNLFKNLDELIANFADSLSKLLNKIKNYETLLKPSVDNIIQGFSFENDYSFFKWSSKMYPIEVRQLLNGKNTKFLASLDTTLFDAVKFCTLYLTIEVKNSNSSEQINNVLRNFFVELTHSGISNYKYKNSKYVIELNFNSAEKLKLRYQYGSTDPSNANESFKKLSANRPMLSPYTFWDIELVAINQQLQLQYLNELNSLINYEDEIVISLNGKGQYLVASENERSNDVCSRRRKRSFKKLAFL